MNGRAFDNRPPRAKPRRPYDDPWVAEHLADGTCNGTPVRVLRDTALNAIRGVQCWPAGRYRNRACQRGPV